MFQNTEIHELLSGCKPGVVLCTLVSMEIVSKLVLIVLATFKQQQIYQYLKLLAILAAHYKPFRKGVLGRVHRDVLLS